LQKEQMRCLSLSKAEQSPTSTGSVSESMSFADFP